MGRTNPTTDEKPFGYHFNSLAPCGANPANAFLAASKNQISTHSPRVGRTRVRFFLFRQCFISTHSPRVGRTYIAQIGNDLVPNFNSLAPCGANQLLAAYNARGWAFQLTRPVWGEPNDLYACLTNTEISTHSPRVGRTCCRHSC